MPIKSFISSTIVPLLFVNTLCKVSISEFLFAVPFALEPNKNYLRITMFANTY
jgi:hypothetical protein